jgi:hypothetical protein
MLIRFSPSWTLQAGGPWGALRARWRSLIRKRIRFDRIVWNSRQHVATLSLVLWSTRPGAVRAEASTASESLFFGPGYDRVVALANAMDVVVVL